MFGGGGRGRVLSSRATGVAEGWRATLLGSSTAGQPGAAEQVLPPPAPPPHPLLPRSPGSLQRPSAHRAATQPQPAAQPHHPAHTSAPPVEAPTASGASAAARRLAAPAAGQRAGAGRVVRQRRAVAAQAVAPCRVVSPVAAATCWGSAAGCCPPGLVQPLLRLALLQGRRCLAARLHCWRQQGRHHRPQRCPGPVGQAWGVSTGGCTGGARQGMGGQGGRTCGKRLVYCTCHCML